MWTFGAGLFIGVWIGMIFMGAVIMTRREDDTMEKIHDDLIKND